MGKRVLKLILFGVLGYILFNIIVSLTEITILNYFGLKERIINIFKDNFVLNLSIYIITYFTMVISIYLYDKYIVKKLNDKLKKMRKGEKRWIKNILL